MDKINTKTMAVILSALMVVCVLPVFGAAADDVEAADAPKPVIEGEVDYNIYLQLKDGEDTFSQWLPTVTENETSQAALSDAVVKACAKAGITTNYDDGWVTEFVADGISYEGRGDFSQPGYMGFAQYYIDDGSWGSISSYVEGTTVAITFGEYMFTDPGDDINYFDTTYGWWAPACLLGFNTVTFHPGEYGGDGYTTYVPDGMTFGAVGYNGPVAAEDGMVLKNWYVHGTDGDVTVDDDTVITDNMDLYANWGEDTFGSTFINVLLVVLLLIMFVVPLAFFAFDRKQ